MTRSDLLLCGLAVSLTIATMPPVEAASTSSFSVATPSSAPAGSTAQSAPPRAPQDAMTLQGEAEFRWWGLHLYDARLWSGEPVSATRFADVDLVLELTYARRFRGRTLAERSLQEMEGVTTFEEAAADRWLVELTALLPSVRPGDRLAAWHRPGRGLVFLHNGQELGGIDDPAFARAFLAVWLSEQSPAPELHQALLGLR